MKILKRLLFATFAVVLVSACSKTQADNPYMLFEIQGRVLDTDGNPIQGIQVSSGQADVVTTNVNGVFAFYGRIVPSSLVVLTFEDKDGEENGGWFASLSKDISVNEKTPGSESGNYKGTYFAGGVEVILLKKNTDKLETPDDELIPL